MSFKANCLYFCGFIYIPKKAFAWRTRRWIRRTFRLYADPAQVAAYIYVQQSDENVRVFASFDADDMMAQAAKWHIDHDEDFGLTEAMGEGPLPFEMWELWLIVVKGVHHLSQKYAK